VFVLTPGPTDAIHGKRLAFTLAQPFLQISRDDLLGAIFRLGFVAGYIVPDYAHIAPIDMSGFLSEATRRRIKKADAGESQGFGIQLRRRTG
jgi:hypothetical protein